MTFALLVLMLLSYVNAEFWKCFNDGERINFCNPAIDDRTCDASNGCILCMSNYNSASSCYTPGNWMACMNFPQECGGVNENNSSIDKQAPILTLRSPVNNQIYNARNVFFDLTTDESASILWIDNINGRGVWNKIANMIKNMNKAISFKDGLNNITIKAIDNNDNYVQIVRYFYVDSTKPKIGKSLPVKGFADGNFIIDFTEANPKALVLNYGNPIKGMRTANVNLNTCTILDTKGKKLCSLKVSLNDYNNQDIIYWFKLTDIANNFAESKHILLGVDFTSPVLKNPDSFWRQDGKYIYISMNITEANFDKVEYIDNSGKLKKICSKLNAEKCEKKISFGSGSHIVDFIVTDKAGNFIKRTINFNV